MPADFFEKPKDWNVAPKSDWVSGTPIGSGDIKMPSLGNPGYHKDASKPVSFGDDMPSLWQGRPVSQCPAGTTSENGICTPSMKSQASAKTKMRAIQKQFVPEEGGGKSGKEAASPFDRELPEAPRQADPQVQRLVKEGVKGREQ
jgi:hypothetical protein